MTFEMYLPAMEKFVVNACPRCGKKPKVLASLDHFDVSDKIIYTVTRTAVCEKCEISADLVVWNKLSWEDDDDQS